VRDETVMELDAVRKGGSPRLGGRRSPRHENRRTQLHQAALQYPRRRSARNALPTCRKTIIRYLTSQSLMALDAVVRLPRRDVRIRR
jgi:hypothetical protein